MKRTIIILAFLVALDVIGLGGFWFGYSAMQEKKSSETELRKELDNEMRKGSEGAKLRRTLKQAEMEKSELAKYFYTSDEESQIHFVAQLEALGLPTSGALVKINSLALVGDAQPSFHGELTLTGRWEEIYRFLRLIEVFPARLIIQRFSAQSQGARESGVVEWRGGMSIDLMSLKK